MTSEVDRRVFEEQIRGMSTQEITANPDDLAADTIIQIFKRFNWNNQWRQMLHEDQKRLREHCI